MVSTRSEQPDHKPPTRWLGFGMASLRELGTLVRASISSVGATLLDGLVYQILLIVLGGLYGPAAFLGAMVGGVTNFSINRVWTFPGARKHLGTQAFEYALASLATYAVLHLGLFISVEYLFMDERVAWLPAKLVAWIGVSYPLQRFLVFGGQRAAQPSSNR